jgi:type II secretory pathway pseudopilin PulG
MRRGFLLLELLIAMAVMSSTMTALSLTIFGLPFMAHNAELKLEAVLRAQEILTTLATTSDSFYMDSLRTEPLEDESFTSYTANVSWTNLFGTSQSVELSTI